MAQFVGTTHQDGVATVTLTRAELHNAFNEVVIEELTRAFRDLDQDVKTRLVVLAAAGKSFCAGADIYWMKRMVDYTFEENVADANLMADMLRAIRECSKPVVARVHGAAIGGGVGLVAACDMAVAVRSVVFSLSEVRLGILPAVISPYVLEKIGPGAARRYGVTAERFDGTEAKRIGLISESVETPEELDPWIAGIAKAVKGNGPKAVAACKKILSDVTGVPWADVQALTTKRISELRVSEEGQDGLKAFLEKRKPGWVSSEESPLMFKKILIANRGEIAVRITRTVQQMGVGVIAVFSDPDRLAPHVVCADEAYALAGESAADTYLRGDKIIEIAKQHGAEAIHPGYGFLSENAAFAQACGDAGLTFIGPTPEVIRSMGDKLTAKKKFEQAGVPVVPGWSGAGDDPVYVMRGEADRIGYPVLVKAAAGGGGKGMRVVASAEELAAAIDGARHEAGAAFGDARVFLEKFIIRPRHVEIQIFGDTHGNVVHLFERECSVQRRHQKIVEESPSPAVSDSLREEMAAAAVRAARAIGYTGAGTVEFMVDDAGSFYFLEVNTRLQVEHPVTEMITGCDLVAAQLVVASGGELPFSQDDLQRRGHAIECRIYAEDASRGFMPSIGTLGVYEPPVGPNIRVDSGVVQGSSVTVHYDPMLAKLVVWGASRDESLARMRWALQRYPILGVTTNVDFLQALIEHPSFVKGEVHTQFLDETTVAPPSTDDPPDEALIAGAWALSRKSKRRGAAAELTTAAGPWDAGASWRMTR